MEQKVEMMLGRCMGRFQSWPAPPNWCRTDWLEEIYQTGCAAAWKAVSDYNPESGVLFDAFVYQRIMANGRTRYRQEWSYGMRSLRLLFRESELSDDEELAAGHNGCINHPIVVSQPDPVYEEVREALARLPEEQRWLMEQLYWRGHTETDLGIRTRLTRRAINKRKQAFLECLRDYFSANSGSSTAT